MQNRTEAERFAKLGEQLAAGSLTDATVQRATENTPDVAILPWVNVVKIGGQSIMDRGRAAVGPIVTEIVANLSRHTMILSYLAFLPQFAAPAARHSARGVVRAAAPG